MSANLSGTLFTIFLLPLVATAAVAAAIRYFDWQRTDGRLVSAAGGIGTVWISAHIIGMPGFPPPQGGISLTTILLIGLILGSLLDQFLPTSRSRSRNRIWETGLDFAFAFGAIAWFRGQFDLWSAVICLVWGIIFMRLRWNSEKSSTTTVMILLSTLGLALISWTADNLIDRNFAFGVMSATLGMSIWLWLNRSLHLGYGYLWGGFTVQIFISLRIMESNLAMLVPIVILAFIFYSDTTLPSLVKWKPSLRKIPAPIIVGVLSILPIVLSLLITFPAYRFNYGN